MHGRPRQKAGPPDPEKVKAAAQKVRRHRQLLPPPLPPRLLPPLAFGCAGAPHPHFSQATLNLPQAALFGQLAGEVLARRAARRYDAESLGLAAKLVELHPEASACAAAGGLHLWALLGSDCC